MGQIMTTTRAKQQPRHSSGPHRAPRKITLNLEATMWDRLEQIAKQRNVDVADWIRESLINLIVSESHRRTFQPDESHYTQRHEWESIL